MEYDVLIIGAGLSGIGTAVHLAQQCPQLKVAILERRQSVGGTWDLFRYPGIRSDSDMLSFGFEFRPWLGYQVLAAGGSIRDYVRDTAREYGIERNIRFGLKITRTRWSSDTQRWTVSALEEASGQTREFSCRFLISCTGYYNYDQGYQPEFAGLADFKGQFIHPQKWPENLDYRGKRVVVIGSGATAVTLVPAMAEQAAQVTMLQRSPTYIFSIPAQDKISQLLGYVLPQQWVYRFGRWRNIFLQRSMYRLARRYPNFVRGFLLRGVRKALGGEEHMAHFTPRYQPWDERLCAVPDGDLFAAIRAGKADVVTDHIERFTANGILLKSGRELPADIIISATGLQVQLFGGAELEVDGKLMQPQQLMTYKAVLVQDIPNMGILFGYTNAPWTLKADLAARYLCRLLNHMQQHQVAVATPRAPAGEMVPDKNIFDLASGYVQRVAHTLPRQGRDLPWRVLHDYERDKPMLLEEPIADSALEFQPSVAAAKALLRSAA
ncbi:Predicted flavoprotein CzcO associated with the cation diffusion facilitator CzcD [Solimonas aquatica]|uniref:Predicted flavoprotein CzcO associated with the cation diffusion facilitator CzcD n=1 Tax=Solimonas aquatica TaxID=489703 RepID=A0A1H9M2A2_9GAMM|nr:NAD(P)/FAD-dependent oxidoreductase [Solimonas aquatica]SER17669.1 Predicted flavoprotein CzcO associated with the cation diffusion facilitator CzcD [Solimonas aquatica]